MNLDIGGGTTNIARFTNGALTDTACLNVGGRLVKLEPDGRVTYVSPVLQPFVPYAPGDRLTPQDLAPAVALLTEILEEALGFRPVRDEARLRRFVTDRLPGPAPGAVYSFSGGVADLMDDRPREPFAYGDLGVLLGRPWQKAPSARASPRARPSAPPLSARAATPRSFPAARSILTASPFR